MCLLAGRIGQMLGFALADSLVLGRLGERFVKKLVDPVMHELPWESSPEEIRWISWFLATLNGS